MTNPAVRYVGSPDFHDGYVRAVSLGNNQVQVSVEGYTGKEYIVRFEGVVEVEMLSPQDMMLYAMSEKDTEVQSLRKYEFINWYSDEPNEPESRSFLRVLAASFTITPTATS